MNTKQYTIRNIPPQVDLYLRKRARLSGKSLNEVVIDELSTNAGTIVGDVVSSLDWFIGSGIDEKTLQVIARDEKDQKALMAKELGLDT